eukprot:CAMPEP_0206294658 /NCGR_PEP_ID=MMETSP0106_2-20121207/4771_1 /ASSEMBLY_ACC=CAM_ASM_000206 /TAXON_ID=81532 /ORGANISM="Acanthoeca-like sp., Strain 10tr" /LENGTH=96 /DNA_ID=CAMNT_0053725301 /DNA_START=240 /DNA_END=530 /DNA_ORIENTATION=-
MTVPAPSLAASRAPDVNAFGVGSGGPATQPDFPPPSVARIHTLADAWNWPSRPPATTSCSAPFLSTHADAAHDLGSGRSGPFTQASASGSYAWTSA